MPRKESGDYVEEEMHSYKRGNKRIKNRKQAIAIGLSKARKAGKRVPSKSKSSKKSTSSRRSSSSGRSSYKKAA
jgi:hypothetical protein